MLIIDTSNVINSGVNAKSEVRRVNFDDQTLLAGIPYLMSKLANFSIKSETVVFVFDPDKNSNYVKGFSPFETHRLYNPQVTWELLILQKLLSLVSADIIQSPEMSADNLIHSVLVDYDAMLENHYIVSADQDLTCNIWDRSNGYSNSFLAFNSKSYNFSKENFYPLLKVPYNFMNLHKTLTGCKSDNIPTYPKGSYILQQYYKYLEDLLAIATNDEFTSIRDFHKVFDVTEFNTWEAFKEWAKNESNLDLDIKTLEVRQKVIFPKYKSINLKFNMDWVTLNSINYFLFGDYSYTNPKQSTQELTKEKQDEVLDIVKNTPKIANSVFIPNSTLIDANDPIIEGLEDLSIFEEEETVL